MSIYVFFFYHFCTSCIYKILSKISNITDDGIDFEILVLVFLDYDRLRIGGIIFTVLLVIGAFLLLFCKFHFLLLDLAHISAVSFGHLRDFSCCHLNETFYFSPTDDKCGRKKWVVSLSFRVSYESVMMMIPRLLLILQSHRLFWYLINDVKSGL